MKPTIPARAIVALTAVACSTALVGCGSTQNSTDRVSVALYRTAPILLESEFEQPIRLSLAAGDQLVFQVRDVYLARAEGVESPAAEPFIVAQTSP